MVFLEHQRKPQNGVLFQSWQRVRSNTGHFSCALLKDTIGQLNHAIIALDAGSLLGTRAGCEVRVGWCRVSAEPRVCWHVTWMRWKLILPQLKVSEINSHASRTRVYPLVIFRAKREFLVPPKLIDPIFACVP